MGERELPVGWATATVSETFELVTSGSRGWAKYYSDDGPLFIRMGNLDHGSIDLDLGEVQCVTPPDDSEGKRTRLEPNDILISITAELGMVALVPEDLGEAYVNQHVALARPSSEIDARYLAWYLASESDGKKQLLDSKRGATKVGLGLPDIRNLILPFAPLNEQRRIAAKLDTTLAAVDACRQRLDGVAELLKRFRQAVLAAATSGELTREWREENPEEIDASSLAAFLQSSHELSGGHKQGNAAAPTDGVHDLDTLQFPNGWCLAELRDVVRPDRPITYGILKPGPELEEGIPYIRVADFPGDRLSIDGIRKTSLEIDQAYKRSRLKPGDLLLSIRGTVGRLISIPPELEGANITQDTARLSVQEELSVSYVKYALHSELLQSRMRRAVKGVAVRGINIGDVRALQIPLPSIQEQEEIVHQVNSLLYLADQLEARLTAARKVVDRLTPALLAKAFRGELVPQDPGEEPASVLLERIRAARQAGAGAAKPSRRGRPKAAATPEQIPRNAAPVPPDSLPPHLLANVLRECGPLSERALLAASELRPETFQVQLAREQGLGAVRESRGDGWVLLEAVG